MLPAKKRQLKYPRLLFGLEGTFVGRLDTSVKQVAAAQEVTVAAVYIGLGKCRDLWAAHPALDALRQHARGLLDQAGGALSLQEAAGRSLATLPHDRRADAQAKRAESAALLRIVAEVDKNDANGLRYVRLHDREPWLCASEDHVRAVRALGAAADQLVERTVVASPGEVTRTLAEEVSASPLSALDSERLADLAAAASRKAARSSRLEIYPKHMPAERALGLSAAVLRSGLTAEEISRRVSMRYPAADALPPRPELDELLRPHGLQWNPANSCYQRPGDIERTNLRTTLSSLHRTRTALPTQALSMDPEAVVARQFDERLRNAMERRAFRVLGVVADRAREAALALGDRLGVQPVAFDSVLVEAVQAEMARAGIKREDVVHAADRAASGKGWNRLLQLVQAAAKRVAQNLLPPKEPLLLVQPGLIARYQLEGFLRQLMQSAKSPESAAVFLLVPAVDRGGLPRINGKLAIPGLLASQALSVPGQWLANRHNAAA